MKSQTLTINGEGIKPETLDAAVLGKIIIELSKISKESSGESYNLLEINEGSCALSGISGVDFYYLLKCAVTHDFSGISNKTLGYLRNLKESLRPNKLFIDFKDKPLPHVFSSETELPKVFIHKRYTNLVGKVEHAGVDSNGQYISKLRLNNGDSVKCVVTKEILTELAKNILQNVVIFGTQYTNPEKEKIESFKIDKFYEWGRKPLNEALSDISTRYSHIFNDLNPDEYINNLRKE